MCIPIALLYLPTLIDAVHRAGVQLMRFSVPAVANIAYAERVHMDWQGSLSAAISH